MRRAIHYRPRGERAKCRFCARTLPRPARRGHSLNPNLPGGSCPCGAFFVVDPTGRNGGVALVEALTDASGDRGRANYMQRGRDYEEFIENYEPPHHRYITGFRGYRRGMARLYLVRLLPGADGE